MPQNWKICPAEMSSGRAEKSSGRVTNRYTIPSIAALSVEISCLNPSLRLRSANALVTAVVAITGFVEAQLAPSMSDTRYPKFEIEPENTPHTQRAPVSAVRIETGTRSTSSCFHANTTKNLGIRRAVDMSCMADVARVNWSIELVSVELVNQSCGFKTAPYNLKNSPHRSPKTSDSIGSEMRR